MTDGGGCSPLRVARPHRRYMPSIEEQDGEIERLLSKIGSLYAEACYRLAVRGRPITLARFLDAGVCIGLLDPVSNIMANTICTSDVQPDLRAKVLDGAAVEQKLDDMGRRSLDGLVAFLIYFFPYLAEWEAVRYLLLSDADLLAAAHAIVAGRGMTTPFSLTSLASAPAFEAALALAAQVAKHPQPKLLVHAWMSLSCRLYQVRTLVNEVQHHSPRRNMERLRVLLDDPVVPYLAIAWDLASSRHICVSTITDMPHHHTRALRMVLLDTIHSLYLQVLARLPSGELRSHLHRSLLRAGYCYGPMDPVTNIIINTIWYESNFPAESTPVLEVIGPKSLTRLVSRSFYGLVSFLQTRYHDLSEHQAIQCLASTCGWLSVADPNFYAPVDKAQQHRCFLDDHLDQFTSFDSFPFNLRGSVINPEQHIPSASIQEAYEAAATAAWHSSPEQHSMFLSSWKGFHQFCKDKFSSEDVRYLCSVLSPSQPPTPERICSSSYHVKVGKIRSEYQQRMISRKVKAALNRQLLRDEKLELDLHIICCVNEDVCGPEYCDDVMDFLSVAPCKYRYSHVNFFATQKGSLFSDSRPVLFFAELDNEKDDGALLFCCQVDVPAPFTEQVRCLYCEARGVRVVHPCSENFHGGGSEFEKMIRGEHNLDNDFLICKNEFAVRHMCSVEEDFIYVNIK